MTARAASLRRGGIVMIGVLRGTILAKIRRPPRMLPQASRFSGRITIWLFSLIGEIGKNRGCPIVTW